MPPRLPSWNADARLQPTGDLQSEDRNLLLLPDVDGDGEGEQNTSTRKVSHRSSASGTASPGSTSAGSGHSPRIAASPYSAGDMLSHSYPVPVVVKNTFIDVTPSRPVSLEGFFAERVTVSCPGSGLEPGARPRDEKNRTNEGFAGGLAEAPDTPSSQNCSLPGDPTTKDLSPETAMQTPMLPPGIWAVPPGVAPTLLEVAVARPQREVTGPLATTPISRCTVPGEQSFQPRAWSGIVGTETLRPQVFPSDGSMGHGMGLCKPCAFYHTKGCNSGEECSFCHLCSDGEKKRRARDKKEERRDRRTLDTQPIDPPRRDSAPSWFNHYY